MISNGKAALAAEEIDLAPAENACVAVPPEAAISLADSAASEKVPLNCLSPGIAPTISSVTANPFTPKLSFICADSSSTSINSSRSFIVFAICSPIFSATFLWFSFSEFDKVSCN